MKTLLLALLLILSGSGKGQTYRADSLVYFSNVFNDQPDTIITEEITIVMHKGYTYITKHNAYFKAKITDTLPVEIVSPRMFNKIYKIRTENGYNMDMIISFIDERISAIGLVYKLQIFIYHIENELLNLNADTRQRKYPYFRDWSRVMLSEE